MEAFAETHLLSDEGRQNFEERKRLLRVARIEEKQEREWEDRMNGTHKDVRAILTRLEKAGYTLRHGGSGAVGLLDKEGEIVRFPLGTPLLIHTTPGSDKAIDGIYNSLKKCGIELEREEREMQEANKGANKLEIQRSMLAAKSHVLRERLKKLMLDYEITQSDFYHFADDYCTTHDIEFPKGVQTNVSGFLRGTNLSEKYLPYMERTIQAIEDRDGKIQKGRRMGAKQPKSEPIEENEDEDEPRDREGLPDAGHGDPPGIEAVIDLNRYQSAAPTFNARLAIKIQSLLYRSLIGDMKLTPDEIDQIAQEIAEL